jgi:two-component system chemotaxis response regulator CheB
MQKRIRVLIVDDSQVMRDLLSSLLLQHTDIEVIGSAFDPYDAREKIKTLQPDVITLDVEMPKMDGLTFLDKIMTLRPMPVIMVSTLTGKGTDTAIAALQLGAVDCLAKPNMRNADEMRAFSATLAEKLRIASMAKIAVRKSSSKTPAPLQGRANPSIHAPKLVAIGASTGGVEALTEVLTHLPKNMPPIVITQHMPPLFTASFANRLNGLCALDVFEASDRAPVKPGQVAIAAGGYHLEVVRAGSEWVCAVKDGAAVSSHKPSVDVLFDSVAAHGGATSLGVLLTGMGKDGAAGLRRMRDAGAHTIAQDEASCVVYGMPRAAVEMGAVTEVQALANIASAIKGRCFI